MSGPTRQDAAAPPAAAQGSSLLRTIRAVAWGFLGIRRRSGFEEDTARLNPLHVVAVAIAGVLVFILGLVAVVRWVVAP